MTPSCKASTHSFNKAKFLRPGEVLELERHKSIEIPTTLSRRVGATAAAVTIAAQVSMIELFIRVTTKTKLRLDEGPRFVEQFWQLVGVRQPVKHCLDDSQFAGRAVKARPRSILIAILWLKVCTPRKATGQQINAKIQKVNVFAKLVLVIRDLDAFVPIIEHNTNFLRAKARANTD